MCPLNLGIRAHDLDFQTPEELVQQLRKYHFAHTQFSIEKCFPDLICDYRDCTSGLANYFNNLFTQDQLKISVLGSYVNLSASDLVVRGQAVARFQHYLRLARDFNVSLVGTETGSVGQGFTTANFTEEAYRRVRASVIELVQVAEMYGITVGIEAGQNHPIHSATVLKRLLDEVQSPNLRVIFDPVNLLNLENAAQSEQVVSDALEKLADKIEIIHLKDYQINRQKLQVVPLGTGVMDYQTTLSFIKNQRPGIYTLLEATPGSQVISAEMLLKEKYQQL
ncbi:MAG: sugar phosphate isomerase/epimerase [Lactobacillaceae bacterium]|jgi:sugar phosphate isomerase/epimerase|nr:sugar phosphate isomerase/epimerase [Lactobacillaceae bacterium]